MAKDELNQNRFETPNSGMDVNGASEAPLDAAESLEKRIKAGDLSAEEVAKLRESLDSISSSAHSNAAEPEFPSVETDHTNGMQIFDALKSARIQQSIESADLAPKDKSSGAAFDEVEKLLGN